MGMNKRFVLLYPFALIYWGITSIRNKFFDWGVLSTYKIQLPSVGVGNLSSGGTGKSVVVDYLISNFKKDFRIAVLSGVTVECLKEYKLQMRKVLRIL